ncbi:MAG: NAD-dependent epimerase/dehydratase family protein [Granulosicoccus sp.]
MHILITGNMGYIGPTLTRYFRSNHSSVKITGFDTGFFGHCLSGVDQLPETRIDLQIYGDLRHFPESALDGVDVVVHLAAISNDPMGKSYEEVTHDINYSASIDLAKKAKARGVKKFIFASSCSIYGFAEGGPRTEQDELNPLTAYALSKVAMEKGLNELADSAFNVTCLRFATACGMSDRIRLDLVLNDFVAGAVSTGNIDILSDGTPWRPLITTLDMSRAISWASTREADNGGQFLAVNTGTETWNYQVKELATAVADVIPDTTVSINENAMPDKRSYRVDFSLFKKLAPEHQPQQTLTQAVREIYEGLSKMKFNDTNFRDSDLMRLNVLTKLQASNRINKELFWQ